MLNDMQKFFEVAKVSLWRLEIDNDECFLYGNDCFDELAGCDSNCRFRPNWPSFSLTDGD